MKKVADPAEDSRKQVSEHSIFSCILDDIMHRVLGFKK